MSLILEYESWSDIGGRETNQDRIACIETSCGSYVFVVCDGLGGHKGGELAAAITVDVFEKLAKSKFEFSPEWLLHAIAESNTQIFDESKKVKQVEGMRTTVAVLLVSGESALIGHVGDSRVYHFRDGEVLSVTKDHSVVQMLVDTGEIGTSEVASHPDRNRLLRSLGDSVETPKARITKIQLNVLPRDGFALCTDGFWEVVSSEEMVGSLLTDDWMYQLNILKNKIVSQFLVGADNCSLVFVRIG